MEFCPAVRPWNGDLVGKMGGSEFWSIGDEVRGERLGGTSEGRVCSPWRAFPFGLAVTTVEDKQPPLVLVVGQYPHERLVSLSPEAELIPLSPASRAVPAIHGLVNACWMNAIRMKKPRANEFSGKIIRNFNEHLSNLCYLNAQT